nr:hypothetical protein [Picobirnavirus sp.]
MTLNEMNYLSLGMTREHYRAMDAENKRHNEATERFNIANLDEAARHNLAVERNDAVRNAEMIRHQQAQDTYNMFYLGEQQRHNQAMEAVNQYDSTTKRLSMYDTSTNSSAANAIAARRLELDNMSAHAKAGVDQRNAAVNEQNAATREYEAKIKRDVAISSEARGWASTAIDGIIGIGKAKTNNAPKQTIQEAAEPEGPNRDYTMYINGEKYEEPVTTEYEYNWHTRK